MRVISRWAVMATVLGWGWAGAKEAGAQTHYVNTASGGFTGRLEPRNVMTPRDYVRLSCYEPCPVFRLPAVEVKFRPSAAAPLQPEGVPTVVYKPPAPLPVRFALPSAGVAYRVGVDDTQYKLPAIQAVRYTPPVDGLRYGVPAQHSPVYIVSPCVESVSPSCCANRQLEPYTP